MNDFDDVIARLTRRLAVDPELQMDVANELRAHLEDSCQEFTRAGYDDAQAAEKALQVLGEEKDLAEQIWQANRRRIRLRRAAKWSARILLVPAAVAVVALIVVGMMPVSLGPSGDNMIFISSWQSPGRWGSLSEEQRWILWGDPKAKGPVEALKSISDRWPDDPVYYANYAGTYVSKLKLPEALTLLDRGEALEPENAFYNFMKAALLVESSSKLVEDPQRTYEARGRANEQPQVKRYDRIEIADPVAFRRGLEEFLRGAAKPYCTGHAVDLLKIRMAILPKDRRLSDHLRRVAMQVFTLLPALSKYRTLAKSADACAVELARQGRVREAEALVKAAEAMGAKIGGDAQTLIELLVGWGITDYTLAYQELLYRDLGQADQAARARESRLGHEDFLLSIRDERKTHAEYTGARPRMGLLWSALMPAIPGYANSVNFEPVRQAERAVYDEMALVWLLLILLLILAIFGLTTAFGLLRRRRRGDGPRLYFVGWRRVGWICLLGVVAPLAGYVIYSYFTPVGGRQYGLNLTLVKALLEYVVTAAAVFALVLGLSYEAVRRRAGEAGMTVPPPWRLRDRKKTMAVAVLLIVSIAVYLATWNRTGEYERFENDWIGLALLGAVVAFLFFWGLYELGGLAWMRGPLAQFRRTFFRSAAPILAAAVIVVGLFCGLALAHQETAAVSGTEGAGGFLFSRELEGSDYRLLKDRLAERHRALLATIPADVVIPLLPATTTQPATASSASAPLGPGRG